MVDKYGRRIQKQTPGEDLRRFYKLEGEEEEEDYKKQKKEKKQDCDSGSDDDGDEEDKDQADTSPLQASSDDESSSSSSPSSEPEVIDGYQRARGGKIVESSDESSSDEDDETAGQDVLDENYDDAITTGPYGKVINSMKYVLSTSLFIYSPIICIAFKVCCRTNGRRDKSTGHYQHGLGSCKVVGSIQTP